MYELGHSPKPLIESLELVRLHSPPHILGKLLDICNNPDGTTEQLAEIIRIDAALTSRVIMAVNSVAFASERSTSPGKQTRPRSMART